MHILVCDTSNSSCCVGVYDIDLSEDNSEQITELSGSLSLERRTHSEVFLPLVKEVFDECKLSIADIDAYAVVVGPGSFTGIRIGISSIKGFAIVNDCKVIEVTSTSALAHSIEQSVIRDSNFIVSCFDARNKRVFGAVYDSNMNVLIEENAYSCSELANRLLELITENDTVVVCGNGSNSLREEIDSGMREECACKPTAFTYLSEAVILPEGIARSASHSIRYEGDSVYKNAINLSPKYCAKSQAERFKKPIEIQIAEAKREDVMNITVLEAESLEHPWTRDEIVKLIEEESKIALVAINKETNELLGYVGASCVLDEAEIGNICVFGKYRRLGVGKRLLSNLYSKLSDRSIKTVFLEVRSDNYPAISLYESMGFSSYGKRKDYYGLGADAILYKCDTY